MICEKIYILGNNANCLCAQSTGTRCLETSTDYIFKCWKQKSFERWHHLLDERASFALLQYYWDKKGMDVCKKSTEHHPTVPHPVFARAQAKATLIVCSNKFGHPHVEFCSPLSSWPFHVLPPRRNKNTHFRHHENLYERGAASLAKKTSLFRCMSRRLFSSSAI